MTPGASTHPTYSLRVLSDPESGEVWVIRHEYNDDGEHVGAQQLQADGWWGEASALYDEAWAGDPDNPTSKHGTYSPLHPYPAYPPVGGTPVTPGSGWYTSGGTYPVSTPGSYTASTTASTIAAAPDPKALEKAFALAEERAFLYGPETKKP